MPDADPEAVSYRLQKGLSMRCSILTLHAVLCRNWAIEIYGDCKADALRDFRYWKAI